jgi:hypothetical protein
LNFNEDGLWLFPGKIGKTASQLASEIAIICGHTDIKY